MRAALYARVSTVDQHAANQLPELRAYVTARGWQLHAEYVDEGISGAKESRPALDRLMADAKRRRFDVLLVWKLDRLGRNLRHLVLTLDALTHLGVAFVSLNEGIDCTSPTGRLQLHILAAFSEFERGRIQERVIAGLARVKAEGKVLGRPRCVLAPVDMERVQHLSTREAARVLGVSRATIARLRSGVSQ